MRYKIQQSFFVLSFILLQVMGTTWFDGLNQSWRLMIVFIMTILASVALTLFFTKLYRYHQSHVDKHFVE